MNRKLAATLLLYTFGLDTVAFAAARPVPRETPPRTVTRAPVSPMRVAAPPEPAPLALAPAPLSPILLDGGSPQLVSCDHDAQGAVLVASVGQSTSVDFNVDPPACSGDPDLCGAFSYDKSGPTPDTWKAMFDVGGKKLRIETGATVSVVNVPASSNNQKAPGLEIKSSCGLEVQAGASVSVGSVNQPAGDIFIKIDGDVQIDGTVRNSVSGTNGTPGKITIASCFGDLTTGPQSRIETLGVGGGGKDINLLTCPAGGDVTINGLVRAVHTYGATPNVNVVSFGGSVTVDGRNDFGEEVESGTTIRRTSGLLARTTNATAAGKVRVQAKHDVTVLGNRILNSNRTQYGAVAVKPHSTNGQGGDGDLLVRSLEGRIVASDRAFDFANRFNALNAISLEAKDTIELSVTSAVNDGAADNTKAVVSAQGGSAGQGGTNTLRSFSGQITIGQNAQVLANFTGTPGTNGTNALAACGGVFNSGTVTPADANLSDDSGTCSPAAPTPLFTSCEEFGVFPPTGPQNQPPAVDAGPDLSITLPATAALDATVSDDGLPPGGSLAVSWAKLSGPGTVVFGNASAVDTPATFGVAGTYELRLTATDSELLRSDDVIVLVGAANQAPLVDAGPDKAITLPTDTVTLDGIASDDGLPAGSGLLILWSVVSGPGSVTFGSPSAASTTATFQVEGTYELRLSATDGALSSSDTAIVTVASQPPAQAEESGFVSGMLVDRANSQPLAGVRVKMRGVSGIVATDAAGRFTYPTPGTGSFTLFFETAGYVTARRDASVVSQRHASVGTVPLAALDAVSTVITPAGGTHTDSTGKLQAIFPPGAVNQAIAVSATYFPRDRDFPLPIPEGIVFVAGVQMTPEHTSFEQPVTLRFANELSLAPGTEVPFAFASHDPEDVNEGFYDAGLGVVTGDGLFVEAVVSHFSCVTLGVKPPQGQSKGGSGPTGGQPPGAKCPGGQNNSGPTSSICISDGGVRLEQRLASVGALGGRDGLEFTYSSLTAFPRPLVTARSQLSELFFDTPPERQTWTLGIEGVERQFSFQGTTQASHFSAFWDGLNASGVRVPTGVYDYTATATSYFRGTLFSSDSFGSLPTTSTNVSSAQALPYSAPASGNVIFNDQSSSPFGAGWSLSELERLYPQPTGTVLWIDGGGNEAVMRPGKAAAANQRIANGLGRSGGLARDAQGNLYVGDFSSGTIQKVTPDGSVTPFASTPAGLSDLAFDRLGNLYALNYFGSLYRVSPAGEASPFPALGLLDQGDLVVGPSGDVFVIDSHHPAIYRVTASGQAQFFAGYRFPNNLLTYPSGIVMDGAGNLYVSNSYNTPGAPVRCGVSFISKISPNGNHSYYALDLNAPRGLALDAKGNLYVADTACDGTNTVSIKAVASTGAVTTLETGYAGLFPSASPPFGFSNDLVADDSGSVYLVTETGELFRTHQTAPPFGVRVDYNGPASEFAKLLRHEDGSFTRTNTDGTRSLFDAQGRQTARIETDGDTITYVHDAQGRLISRTNAVGQVWSFDYVGNALASVTDPAGRTTRFATDASGNLAQVTHPDGSVVGFAYDARHLLTSKTDARGFTTSYSYDANGRATDVSVPTGETRRFDPGRVRAAVENLPPGVGTPENLAPPVLTADLEDRYTDGRSLTTRYVSNAFGSVERTVRPDGVVHEIERDVDNQPTLLREPNGGIVRQKFDAKGNLVQYEQEGGLFFQAGYHRTFSKPVFIRDIAGLSFLTYDAGGNLIETTDPRSAKTRYTRDAHGLPTRVELPDGGVVQYGYDAFGRLIEIRDPLDRVTAIEYDAAGNPSTVTDAAGRQTRYAYDAMNRRTLVTDALDGETTFAYQAACSGCDWNQEVLVSLTDAKGQTTSFEYDAIGQLVRATDTLGRSRGFAYDLDRNLTSVTDPKGQTINFEYDPNDRLIRRLRPEGTVEYGYDSVGNLISLSDENSSLTLEYDVANRMIRTTPGGLLPALPIENGYDRRNLRTSQAASWNSLSYSYDRAGNLDGLSGIPGASATLSLNYDPLNRRLSTSGLVAESLAYDRAGQLLSRQSRSGSSLAWQYLYDLLGNRSQEIQREAFRSPTPVIIASPDPSVAPTDTVQIQGKTSWPTLRIAGTEYSVAPDGSFSASVSVAPGPNSVLVEALSPAGVAAASRTLQITHEPGGAVELTELLGGEATGGVFASEQLLDGSTRVVKVTADGVIEAVPGLADFSASHVARAADGTLYVWSSDSLYRLEGDQRVFVASAPSVPQDVGLLPDGSWVFVQAGDPTLSLFDPTTGELFPWVTLPVTGSLRVAANSAGDVFVGASEGRVFRVAPTGDATEWTATVEMFSVTDVALDDAGVASIAGAVLSPSDCAESGGNACFGLKRLQPDAFFAEQLDAAPTRIMADGPGDLYFLGFRALLLIFSGSSGVQTIPLSPPNLVVQLQIDPPTEIIRNFAYDSLDRLVSADPGENYAYDPVGNRSQSHLSTAHLHDQANQLLEDDSFTYSYDANGNLTSKVGKLDGTTTSYSWDSEDRLIRVELPGTVAEYVYDPLGRRIQKAVNGEVARYLYDGEDIVAELDAANNVVTSFVHGPGIDEPLAIVRDGRTYTYHRDALGSITHITDDAGLVVQRYAYDAYGNVTAELDPDFIQPYGFTGRERDRETGLLYYRARYMDPRIGRFISEDPVGFAGGVNFYAYVENNPINSVDPVGLIDNSINAAIRSGRVDQLMAIVDNPGITAADRQIIQQAIKQLQTPAQDLVTATLKRSPSYASELEGKTFAELLADPSQKAKAMVKLIKQAGRLMQKLQQCVR